jgi:hypothetical protein
MNAYPSELHAVTTMNKGDLKDEMLKQKHEIRKLVQEKYSME